MNIEVFPGRQGCILPLLGVSSMLPTGHWPVGTAKMQQAGACSQYCHRACAQLARLQHKCHWLIKGNSLSHPNGHTTAARAQQQQQLEHTRMHKSNHR
jgi:hypothetical protein